MAGGAISRDNVEADVQRFDTMVWDAYPGSGEVPADKTPEPLGGVPSDYMTYFEPGDETVQEYAAEMAVDEPDEMHGFGDSIEFELPYPFEYVEDKSREAEQFQYASDMLEDGEQHGRMVGDCEDYAILVANLFAARGHPVRLTRGIIRYEDDDDEQVHWVAEIGYSDDDLIGDRQRYVADVPYTETDTGTLEEGGAFYRSVADWDPLTMFGPDLPYQVYQSDKWGNEDDDGAAAPA